MHAAADVASVLLKKTSGTRPVVVAAFGKRLAKLRGDTSASVVVRRLKQYGVELGASTLYQYEAGTVNAPDPGVLLALAKIYRVPVEHLIELLIAARAHPTQDDAGPVLVEATDPEERSSREMLKLFMKLEPDERQQIKQMISLVLRARLKTKSSRAKATASKTKSA